MIKQVKPKRHKTNPKKPKIEEIDFFNLSFLTKRKGQARLDSESYIRSDLMPLATKEVIPKLIRLANRKAKTGAKFITSRTNANKTVIRLKQAIRAKNTNSFNLAL